MCIWSVSKRAIATAVCVSAVLTACATTPAAPSAPAASGAGASSPTTAPAATEPTTAAPAATAATGGGAAAGAGEPIPICFSVAQTSNTALLGQDQLVGAKIAEKYFNDKGGVNGRPIKLFYEDTAGDENGAINAFQNCINKDKVVGIIGPTLSQQAFAADKVADAAKVPVMGPSNTAKGIPQIGPYVARVSAPVSIVAPNAVKEALKQTPNIKNVAVAFAQNDAFSKSETGTFQNAVTNTYKLNLVTVQTFQTTDTDFTTQATNIINAKPDLVIISGLAADGGNLVKQLRDLGYKGPMIGGNGFNTTKVFPVCQQQCDGLIIAQAYAPGLDSQINKDFIAGYDADQKSKLPPQLTAQAFAAVQVYVEALKAVDGKSKLSGLSLEDSRTALNMQIKSGATYDTPLGVITFDKEGEILQNTFYVAQVKMSSASEGIFNIIGTYSK